MSRSRRRSAGILVFRRSAEAGTGSHDGAGGLEVLLVHPGGPYWARRDDGWWSLPKGEVGESEDELAAARREFVEELGVPVPAGPLIELGEVVQAGGKSVVAWGVEGDVDVDALTSGTFEMEWPPRSGERRSFPEVDRALWCPLDLARVKLLPGQVPFVERLAGALGRDGTNGGARPGLGASGPNR